MGDTVKLINGTNPYDLMDLGRKYENAEMESAQVSTTERNMYDMK